MKMRDAEFIFSRTMSLQKIFFTENLQMFGR